MGLETIIAIVRVTIANTGEIMWSVPELQDVYSTKRAAVTAIRNSGYQGKIIINRETV